MKKLQYLILLAFSVFAFNNVRASRAQTPTSQVTFNTRADLRAQAGGVENAQGILMGLVSVDDQNGGMYAWKGSSTAADDGFITIQVTGVSTGRWVRIGNGNTLKGEAVFSGTGLVSSFTITYSTALPFPPAQVYIQAKTGNAASNWVTNSTATGFTANFSTIPILGTNNIQFSYLVIKQ